MSENELFKVLESIDKDIESIDYKRLREYRTPFLLDSSKNEASLSIFLKYPSRFTVIDGKKMHLDRSFRKVPLLPILEECRRLLVTAMINNRTLVIRLGDSATDFLHTFNDDIVGATLGIIEHEVNDDNNYIEYKDELNPLSLYNIQKLNENMNESNNNDNNNNVNIDINNINNNDCDNKLDNDLNEASGSNTWRSFNYSDNSIVVSTVDLDNNNHVDENISIAETKSLISDLDDYDSLNTTTTDNHTKASHSADIIHQHHRNKADAKVESGQGAFGATEGLSLYNPRPPYKPYSYFPKRVIFNGGLKINTDFWKDRLYRREDLGYGQGKKMESLLVDNNNSKFHVIMTSTHEYSTLQSFLFNGRFGLPSMTNFNIIEIFNDNNDNTNNDKS